jgi:hypothetical protein
MRLVSRLAPPVAIVALGLAITAAPASAERNVAACSSARRDVARYIHEVTFYRTRAGELEAMGDHDAAADMNALADLARALGNAANEIAGVYC